MKIPVSCGCGSTFQAPVALAGQMVRCPSCRKPLTVPDAPASAAAPPPPRQRPAAPTAPPPEQTVDLSDLTSLDNNPLEGSTMQGSAAGRSAIRSAPRKGSKRSRDASNESTVSDRDITQELDDRMSRLYGVYAGKDMTIGRGRGNKLKLLIGLGIAAATIGLGIGVGWHVLKTEYGVTGNSVSHMLAGDDNPTADTAAPVEPVARKQAPNDGVTWQAAGAGAMSGVALSGVEIAFDPSRDDRYCFLVKLLPASAASDPRLSMATAVTLYRAPQAQAPFTQADHALVQGFDRSTGALTFELFDEVPAAVKANLLHYRLSGFDSDGKRLFDTPAAGFPHVSAPALLQGRFSWSPRSEGSALPGLRLQARIDAPGWEDVLLWRVNVDGPIAQAAPEFPDGLPLVVESAAYVPMGITLDGKGVGRWKMHWVGEVLERRGTAGTTVVGVAPQAGADGLDYRLIPDEQRFTSVNRAAASPRGVGVSFVPQGEPEQTLTAAELPTPSGVTATAYNGRVHIGWDSTALIAGIERYDGPVKVAVRRVDSSGRETTVAVLPADSTGYTDADVPNNETVSYEVKLVGDGVSGSDPLMRLDAWVLGYGTLPVLVPCSSAYTTARVTPGAGLDRLFVSLGINELSYDGTGLPAQALHDRLVELLRQTPGVSVVDRAGLRCFVHADACAALPDGMRGVGGSPAQVQLRLVDSTGPGGDGLALWATDLAAGEARLVARANAAEAEEQADLFVTAMRTYLESRMPADLTDAPAGNKTPKLVVVGPIYPVDQPAPLYRASELADQIAKSGDRANPDMPVVTRRFWISDTRQDARSIDHSALADTVLIVGRAWNGQGAMPSVSLSAIDAAGGRLIDRFSAAELDPEALRAFAEWCVALRLPSEPVPPGTSPLLSAEAGLTPIHPVWRQASNAVTDADDATTYPGAANDMDAHVIAFGLPLPSALSGLQDLTMRDPDDPLYAIRPHVAPRYPLTFDEWAKACAAYVEADCAAFLEGFEQVRRIQQAAPGPVRPRLIVRGEHKFTADEMIPAAAGGLRVTPAALNVHTFFPMGAAGQPMIDYRSQLSQMFRARPWAMAHAWKEVTPALADAFLKTEVYGVEDGRYGRLILPDKPVPFHTFVAADLLTNIGNREAYNFRQRALERASAALTELANLGGGNLTPEEKRWATDAMLTLVYVQDPGAIERIADSGFRQQYLSVEPAMQADALRMFVDRADARVWEWAGEFDSVDWPTFVWRSADEMDWATRGTGGLIPQETRLALRDWLDSRDPAAEENPEVITATGPATGSSEN